MSRFNFLKGATPEELRLLAVLGCGSFLMMSSLSSINVALPQIQRDFDISLSSLKWVSIIGAIMVGSTSLCFGRLGDILGRKRVYRTGVFAYSLGAGLSATALSFPHLMVFRVMMATGLAMSTPLAAAIIAANVAPERRGQLIGTFASFAAAGQLMGPTLGGFILDAFGWRAIFISNCGLGMTLVLAQYLLLRGTSEEHKKGPFDFPGALLLLAGYPSLLIALSIGPRSGWGGNATLMWFGISALGLAAFALRETKYHTPLFRFGFFRSISFCIAVFTLIVAQFVQNPVTLFTPLYLQKVLSIDPVDVGLLMMALPISTMIAGPIGGRLADRYEPRLVAGAGAFVTFLAVLFYAQLGLTTPALFVVLPLFLVGIGGGLFRPANQVAVYNAVPLADYGTLSAMLASIGGLAGTMGTTITIAINETRSKGGDAASFASALHFTFMSLLPLLAISVLISLIGRSPKKPEADPATPEPVAIR